MKLVHIIALHIVYVVQTAELMASRSPFLYMFLRPTHFHASAVKHVRSDIKMASFRLGIPVAWLLFASVYKLI
jgi:hypothetical protein